jgi:hypothetical protein
MPQFFLDVMPPCKISGFRREVDVTPEDGTDKLSRNVGNELQTLAA